MKLYEQYQGTSPVLTTNQRQVVTLNNARRNARLRVTIAGTMTIAGAVGGAIKNGGSIAAAVQLALRENGNDTFRLQNAMLYRALAAYDAIGTLSGTRMAAGAAIAAYQLYETFEFPFSMRQQARAAETAYIETNRNAPLELTAILEPSASLNIVTPGGGGTAVLSNVTISATQIFSALDDGTELPYFRPGLEVLELPVPGVSALSPMDVKISDRCSHFLVASVGVDADGATIFAAANRIVNALALYGSGGQQDIIVGPTQTPMQELIDSMTTQSGDSTQLTEGIYIRSFIDQGMLADTIRPDAFANLRFYFNVQPGAALTSSRIIVLARTLTRPPAFAGWRSVTEQLPAWAS